MNKQIEEMASVLKEFTKNNHIMASTVILEQYSETLYKAGYRKQSEGEWKRTTEPLGANYASCVECSACGESWVLDEDHDFDAVNDFWSFCPNCGAKMKGEVCK